jgi:hypothetical protein
MNTYMYEEVLTLPSFHQVEQWENVKKQECKGKKKQKKAKTKSKKSLQDVSVPNLPSFLLLGREDSIEHDDRSIIQILVSVQVRPGTHL